MFSVTLPYPPSVNTYWRRVGSKVLISRAGRIFRQNVVAILLAAGARRISGPLAVEIDIHPPDNRRRDLDNTLKAILDSMQHGGCYDDDSQITRLVVEKREPVNGGKACVVISPRS